MYLKQRFLKILPLVLIIALIPLLSDWGRQQKDTFLPNVITADLPEADLRIKSGSFVEMEGNRVVWQLKAKTAQLFEKDNYAQLEQIKAFYLQDDGGKVMLEGEKGDLRLDSRDLTVSGRVRVIADDGSRLSTESLSWKDSQQKVLTEDWITIERDKMKLTGKGMEADANLNKLIIKEQVTTYIAG